MNKHLRNCAVLFSAVAALGLAGCGGDDNNNASPTPPAPAPAPGPAPAPPPPPAPPPVSMNDPSTALVRQLVGQGGSDTAEPLVLSGTAFPASDTARPDAV